MIRSFKGKTPRIAPSAYVDDTAVLIGDVEIGEESSVWPGAVIRADLGKITIGRQSIVEGQLRDLLPVPRRQKRGCHDRRPGVSAMGRFSTAGPSSNYVLIGTNATPLHEACIGDFCPIGAAALVGAGQIILIIPRAFGALV